MSKVFKYLSMVLSLAIFIVTLWPVCKVNAEEIHERNVQEIRLSEHAYILLRENTSSIVSEYFENDQIKQKAVLAKASGEIIYKEYGTNAVRLLGYEVKGIQKATKTEKYNIRDFQENKEHIKQYSANANNGNFRFLMSRYYSENREDYARHLYGYDDIMVTDTGNWAFKAGDPISIISLSLSFVPGTVAKVLSVVGTVAGAIAKHFSISFKQRDYYWVYKFKQTKPSPMEFVCTGKFIYKTEHRGELDTGEVYWETVYEKSSHEIELEREKILTSPGLY
ncbi:MAG: hypothetical protein K6E19_05750 [Lachnospiraceae bacterium]|nr:hypothetical protein [Lachnospiraceae bacterium]